MTDKAVVYLVNDDDVARDSLAQALAKAGLDVEKFSSPAELPAAHDSGRPTCLVIDLQATEMAGLTLWEKLRARNFDHPFILVTGPKEITVAVEAMRQGAFNVLERPLDQELLVTNLIQALERDASLCQSRQDMADVTQRINELTPRQREVMELVVAGRLTKQIARMLAISTKTVEVHRSNITKRMGVKSVVQLVKMVGTHTARRPCCGHDETNVTDFGTAIKTRPSIGELPRLLKNEKPSVDFRGLKPSPTIAGIDTEPIRILIIEDEPTDVEIARRVLWKAENLKFELHAADNLDDACEQLRNRDFDVALLDLGLPKYCGLESLRMFREHNHNIPIVVLTGLRDENTALEALEYGAQDYLVKNNLSADVLSRSIRFAIQRQQLIAAANQHQLELEARVKLAAIVESSDDAIESENLQGEITSWNQSAERIFGYSKGDVLGWNISFLFPPDRADEIQQILSAVRRGESIQHLDTERLHKDGRRIPISLSVSPIKDRDGNISGISTIARDITESKQVKDLLAQQARDLVRAYADLEHTNQELKNFAYAASHDLKEPLRMITSYCQLLELEYGDQFNAETGKYLRFASDGAKRMQRLIDDLLSFSLVGMTTEPREQVDLHVALDDALLNLEAATQESGVRFEIESLPPVLGHRTLLAMLFQNLIGNAIKFRRPRCVPLVRVSCVARDEDWELTVTDNGIGIEPEYHERVLGLFQRLHTRDEYPGTGIGLATCKKVVELHGGRIWVTSRPQEGTTMHFTLPGCKAATAPTVVESPATSHETIETLLVEDNPGDIELAKAALSRSPISHHVTVARNGLEALALLRRQEQFADRPLPSLILLDLNLSKMNGMDVLAEVKKDPSLKQIRVVVFTSSQTEDDIATAQKLDADEFVTKPVELNRYFTAVRSIGERHAGSVQSGTQRRRGSRTDFYWGSTSPLDSKTTGTFAAVVDSFNTGRRSIPGKN